MSVLFGERGASAVGLLQSTDALASSQAVINDAKSARQELSGFLRSGRSTPAWQPECPFTASDEDLANRFDKSLDSLEVARNHFQVKKELLLLEAKWKSPFKCDQRIDREIESLTRLCEFATPANFQRFVKYYKECPPKQFAGLDPSVRASLNRLLSVTTNLEAEARRRLAKIAHPGTPFWCAEYEKFMARYDVDLQVVVACFQKRITEATESRRQQEAQHSETLEKGFEPKLLPAVYALADQADVARSTIVEVRSAWQREAESSIAIRAVWQGSQDRKQTLFRQPKCLAGADLDLAAQWASGKRDKDFWMKAMELARGAEVIALDIYRELRGNAEDLSIKQLLQSEDRRWLLADIKAGSDFIDVKNAIRSVSSKRRYSEHYIKRFKQDNVRRDVVISGFLSPYLQEGYAGHGSAEDKSVCWLGETTLGTIEKLKREFETDYLQLELPTTGSTIPPWLFDYPGPLYVERDAALARICDVGFVFPRADCPVGAVVLAGRVLKPSGNDQQAIEAFDLSQRRCKLGSVSRPLLYLHILDCFCRSVIAGTPFPAGILREIIFPSNGPILRGVANASTPLAVLDPVEIVCELIDVLEKVSTHCSLHGYGFTRFKLIGRGILRGCRRNEACQTIFTYCGGWKKLKGGSSAKCGRNPLFIDRNDICPDATCGYLICDSCGYCRKECPKCSGRQEHWIAP